MAKKYAAKPFNPNKACHACAKDVRAHFKNTYETAQAIKKMDLDKAMTYLENVISHKECIPFRKFKGCIGRTAQAKAFKLTQGRWPEKSCRVILNLLQNSKSNAERKSLRTSDLHIEHIMVNRAVKPYRRTFRAHGRINPYMCSTCHIEMIVSERSEGVEKSTKQSSAKAIKMKAIHKKKIPIGGA